MTNTSATLVAMRRARVPVTLQNWLVWNGANPNEPLDFELVELLPEPLRKELDDRLRMQSENNAE